MLNRGLIMHMRFKPLSEFIYCALWVAHKERQVFIANTKHLQEENDTIMVST